MNSLRISFVLLSCMVFTSTGHADFYGEREALARLVHELAALTPLIDEAEVQADHSARIRFQYDWLRQDLARIRLGIQEHINAPRPTPRSVPPLRGDYRR